MFITTFIQQVLALNSAWRELDCYRRDKIFAVCG